MGCCGNKTEDGEDGNGNNMEMNENGKGTKRKHGQPRKYDPTFNGPIKDRGCTDIICCLIFVLFVLGMLVVGVISFLWGDPMKLLNPTDSEGNICGYTKTVKDRPYLYFFDLTECIPKGTVDPSKIISTVTNCPTYQVCVKKCPTENSVAILIKDWSNLTCKYEAEAVAKAAWSGYSLSQKKDFIYTKKNCAPYHLQSSAIVGRCIPTLIGNSLSKILTDNSGNKITGTNGKNVTLQEAKWGTIAAAALLNLQNVGKRVISDVQTSWYWILGGFGISMAAAFLYILTMRWVAGVMVWLTTYLVLTLIGYATYYCYKEYERLKKNDTSSLSFSFTTNLSSYKDQKETWLALTCILGFILLVLILLLLALRNRIAIAIQLIKEGSRAITAMISTLFFPIIPWLLQLILFAWFVLVLTYLVTSGNPKYTKVINGTVSDISCKVSGFINQNAGLNTSCNFQEYKNKNNLFRMQVYHLFGWFWLMNFIIALGQCVLAGAFASWYWAWDKNTDVPTLPVLSSFGRTLRYHTGSLAFGSLIIAIVQIIRAGLEYLDHKLRGDGREGPGPIAKYVLLCFKCCFWCLEKFIKFLNKNAYIEIAVYGKNFCVSAKNAFMLLMRNILRVAVLDKVTDFILFMGKLAITVGVAIGSFYWFERKKNLNYYLAPVFIITIGAYMICNAFFSVYEMAIDTVFLCFLEDSERHDGTPEKPYYMSKKLQKILGKKNKKSSDSD